MLVLKITETGDGRIIVESPRRVIATFRDTTREEVIRYLKEKADECGEPLRIVDEFSPEDLEERVSIRRLMKPHRD